MHTPLIIKQASVRGAFRVAGKIIKWPFKSTPLTKAQTSRLLKNPAMKSYYGRAIAKRKFLSKGYFKEIGQDIAHPVQSLKRQFKLVGYGVKGKGKIVKRSPLGKAWLGGIYFGGPTYYAGSRLKETDKTSKNEALAVAEIASMITPKMFPYVAVTEAPKLFYKKKKKKTL